jgi:kynurenine formamidase
VSRGAARAPEQAYTLTFLGIPLKLQGATGSPLRPLALVS